MHRRCDARFRRSSEQFVDVQPPAAALPQATTRSARTPTPWCACVLLLLTPLTWAQEWKQRTQHANRLAETGMFQEAVAAYQEAVHLAAAANAPPAAVAALRCHMGSAMVESGNARGLVEMNQAYATLQPAGELAGVSCGYSLAHSYRTAGDYAQARKLFAEARTILEKHPATERDMARILIGIAGVDLLEGSLVSAEKHVKAGLLLQTANLPPEHPDFIGSYGTMAHVLRALHRPAEAIRYAEQELQVRRKANALQPVDALRTYSLLAAANADLRRLRAAGEWAARMDSTLAAHPSIALDERIRVTSAMGYVALERGELQKAESLFEKVRLLLDQQPDPLALATAWTYLGRIKRRRGDFAAAERCHRAALATMEPLPQRQSSSGFLWLDLADTYRLWRRDDDAIRHYRRGLTIVEEQQGAGSPVLARDYEAFAALLHKKKSKEEAVRYSALARRAREQTRNPGLTVDIDELRPRFRR